MPHGNSDRPRGRRVLSRYTLGGELGTGGMGSVHLGRLEGAGGFTRLVAIKRLLPHLATDPAFVAAFLDEARLAALVRHPNVAALLDVDVDVEGGDYFLVMEHVRGVSLAQLVRAVDGPLPPQAAAAIVLGALQGLHAAHEATDEAGLALGLVHRDVCPQNLLVGADGVTRVIDFGVAKAFGRRLTTADGRLKGKVAYMAPERLRDGAATRQVDLYAASVVLWEALTGRRLFRADDDASLLYQVLEAVVEAPSRLCPAVPPELDRVVLQGLARDPNRRFRSALEMADALERALSPWPSHRLGAWVRSQAADQLAQRDRQLAEMAAPSPDEAAPPVEGPESSPPLARPRRRAPLAIALAGAALGLFGLRFVGSRAGAPTPAAPAETATPGAPSAEASAPDALAEPAPSSPPLARSAPRRGAPAKRSRPLFSRD